MIGKTIKSILANNSALIALVPATKIFPYVMNEGTTLPAIVYTINSVEPEYARTWVNDSIEFSVHSFSKDFDNLQLIVSAIRTALELNQTGAGSQDINRIYLTGMNEDYIEGADVFANTLTFNVKINTY